MAGKPPKNKPVSLPIKTPDSIAGGLHRPPAASAPSPLPIPHHSLPSPPSPRPGSVTVRPANLMVTAPIDPVMSEGVMLTAKSSLGTYGLPKPEYFGQADAQGILSLKQRQYVAVTDDIIVQVVVDAETGLFRAKQARELKPSGPLMTRDSEGRYWLALESGDVILPNSSVAQIAELFRRAGGSVTQFSDITVARVLAVTGVDVPVLSDVLARKLPAPFLLEDSVRRFELDQQIQAIARTADERLTRFKSIEDAFEADCDEVTLRMRRFFPELPKTAAQAIWRDTSAAERLHMHNQPGLPRSVAEQALLALRDVRLARACEGIYLDSVSSLDSDLLALQMIGRLAAWPPTVRVEIRQRVDGDVLSAIGDARSATRHVLIRQQEGYVTQHSGERLPFQVKDLYSVVWGLLLPHQRQLLGISDAPAMRRLIRAQPLPSRQAVSEWLGLGPLPSDVTRATAQHRQAGQLRGGGGGDPESPKSFEDRVRDLYPQLSDEEVSSFVAERLKSNPAGVLTRLEKEFATLRDELAIWNANGASPHAQTSGPEGAPAAAGQRQAREQFSAKLQDIWQRKSVSKWGYGDFHFSYHVDFSDELPTLSARFEYVTELILTVKQPGARIGEFLDSFPGIQYLMVTGVKMEAFPLGIFQMRQLRQLTLGECSLKLSEATAEGLSRIETLNLLNLAKNPLTVAPHVGYMTGLAELMLYDANLSSIPTGIDRLKELQVLALQGNNISDVGNELFEIPDTQDLYVGLFNNPLSSVSRQRINHYLENSSLDRKLEIQTEDVVSDSDSESESSESGFSTGSDSD